MCCIRMESNIAISSTMGSNDVMSEGEPLDDKTASPTSTSPKTPRVQKEVVGNQASRDKYFEFTLKLENVGNETRFTVSIADDNDPNTTDGNADATSGSNMPPLRRTVGRKTCLHLPQMLPEKLRGNFILQHG